MSRYESACDVCVNACLHGVRHPSVRQVATADWVQIRHCSRCSTWWDTQPASRPAVISRDEAARRVPDADGWTVVGPLLEPRDREGLLVDSSGSTLIRATSSTCTARWSYPATRRCGTC